MEQPTRDLKPWEVPPDEAYWQALLQEGEYGEGTAAPPSPLADVPPGNEPLALGKAIERPPLPELPESEFSGTDVDEPAANTAAVITYVANATERHTIGGVAWSYDDDPTGGNLTIEDGAGTTIFSMDIVTKGAGFVPFDPPKQGTVNTALVLTLAAGGAGITGKLNVTAHWTA